MARKKDLLPPPEPVWDTPGVPIDPNDPKRPVTGCGGCLLLLTVFLAVLIAGAIALWYLSDLSIPLLPNDDMEPKKNPSPHAGNS